jgi:hypothetical protein
VEFEMVYLLADNWDVSLRGTYFDATIEDWSFRFCPGGEESSPDQLFCPLSGGDPLNSLPQWNSNFQLGYSQNLTANWDFSSRFNWSWQSVPNFTTETNAFSDAKSLLGLSFALQSSAGFDIRGPQYQPNTPLRWRPQFAPAIQRQVLSWARIWAYTQL